MNGYLLVKAAYPNKSMSSCVYNGEQGESTTSDLKQTQAMIMSFSYLSVGTIDKDILSSD